MHPTKCHYVLAGLMATVAACGDPAAPPLKDPRGLLLVIHGAGPTAELYAMRPDGTERRQLTRNTVLDAVPDWSPDGRHIVFIRVQEDTISGTPTRRPEIWVMNADGSGGRRLLETANSPEHPRWSPDGRRITFDAYDRTIGKFRPYVVNADGSNVQPLSSAPGESFSVEWSPDGAWLLFLSNRSPRFWWTMYVMRTDGSGERQLAGDSACTSNVFDPRWSPDGTRIAYTCDQSGGVLYTIRPDGTDSVRVTAPGWGPVWSPDGRQLAFISSRDGGYQIYVKDMSSGVESPVPNSTGYFVAAWGGGR